MDINPTYNPVTKSFGFIQVDVNNDVSRFYEKINNAYILRCICPMKEMDERLVMWGYYEKIKL